MEEEQNLSLIRDWRMKERGTINSTKEGVMYKALFGQCM